MKAAAANFFSAALRLMERTVPKTGRLYNGRSNFPMHLKAKVSWVRWVVWIQ